MTNQEVANKVWAGCKAQKWQPSMSEDGLHCAYRGTEGRKCAIGHLITDEEAERLGTRSIYSALVGDGVRVPSLDGIHPEFLSALQAAHDSASRVGTPIPMDEGLKDVIRRYGCQVPT